MQEELKSLQQRLGITFIFVTHDQGEALSMADRVAVFNEGRIVQEGTPQDIYERPRTRFVADFVGSANVLSPDLARRAGAPGRVGEPAPRGDRADRPRPRAASPARSAPCATSAPSTASPSPCPGARSPPASPLSQPLPRPGETVGLGWSERRPAPDGGRLMQAAHGPADRLSDAFWRRPNLLLLLLLVPPLLWLGVIYVGSLAALLLQSFFSIDEFSGLVRREFTLKTYAELLQPANFDIIVRTTAMAAAVTVASAIVAFPIAYYAARYARGRMKALFYLGVMLPLWSSYLVKIYAWKLILAKEGILNWAVDGARRLGGC